MTVLRLTGLTAALLTVLNTAAGLLLWRTIMRAIGLTPNLAPTPAQQDAMAAELVPDIARRLQAEQVAYQHDLEAHRADPTAERADLLRQATAALEIAYLQRMAA